MKPRLQSIELEAFRGFATAQTIDLDADAVLIRGDNGAGKTSLIDGILWVFTGHLAYLEERVRGLRQIEDAIGNRFTDRPARVVLCVTAAGRQYSFARTGDQKQTEFEATVDGREVADPGGLLAELFGHSGPRSLNQALTTWGLLRQDAVRAALDAGSGTLHQRLSSIVGLERVTGFAQAATETANQTLAARKAVNKSIKELESRHAEAQARVTAATDLADTQRKASSSSATSNEFAAILSELPLQIQLELHGQPSEERVRNVESQLTTLGEAVRRVADHRLAATRAPGSRAAVDRAEVTVREASQRVESTGKAAPITARLASDALDLLKEDTCPVCGQQVEADSLRHHLREAIKSAQELVNQSAEAANELARARAHLATASEELATKTELEAARQRVEEDLVVLVGGFGDISLPGGLPNGVGEAVTLADALDIAISRLRTIRRDRQGPPSAHLQRLRVEMNTLAAELASARDELDARTRDAQRAKELQRQSHAAAENIVERALAKLQPSFAEVFDRLNPNPAFTELRARQDVFRNVNQIVPMVVDPARGVKANPSLVFSEGQLNVVALSYFLGMALNAQAESLPFLIMDDPLQALDTVSVLGFSDLCRRIADRSQLVIATHDRRFADVLTRKLSPRSADATTLVHEFEAWTRHGPSIRSTRPDIGEVVPLIRAAS